MFSSPFSIAQSLYSRLTTDHHHPKLQSCWPPSPCVTPVCCRRQCCRTWRADHSSQWKGEEDQEATLHILLSANPAAGEKVPTDPVSRAARASRAGCKPWHHPDSGTSLQLANLPTQSLPLSSIIASCPPRHVSTSFKLVIPGWWSSRHLCALESTGGCPL